MTIDTLKLLTALSSLHSTKSKDDYLFYATNLKYGVNEYSVFLEVDLNMKHGY